MLMLLLMSVVDGWLQFFSSYISHPLISYVFYLHFILSYEDFFFGARALPIRHYSEFEFEEISIFSFIFKTFSLFGEHFWALGLSCVGCFDFPLNVHRLCHFAQRTFGPHKIRTHTCFVCVCVYLSRNHKPSYSGIYYRITMFMLFVMVLAALRAVDKMCGARIFLSLSLSVHLSHITCRTREISSFDCLKHLRSVFRKIRVFYVQKWLGTYHMWMVK